MTNSIRHISSKTLFLAISILFTTSLLIAGCSTTSPEIITVTEKEPAVTATVTEPIAIYIDDEWDADDFVARYLWFYAATTYHGKQVQAVLVDLWDDSAYHGTCSKLDDGSWEVSVYFDIQAVDEELLLTDVLTEVSLCGPSQREAYDTRWNITAAGNLEPANGNAMRLVAELQKAD